MFVAAKGFKVPDSGFKPYKGTLDVQGVQSRARGSARSRLRVYLDPPKYPKIGSMLLFGDT